MTNTLSWQNSVSLWPASFCTPRSNVPVTPGIFDFLHLHSGPRQPTLLECRYNGHSCLENPWTEEPGGLQSMGSQRVRHDWATLLSFSFLEGLVGLHRTIQLQLLQHYWSGLRLELLWYWMVCLEMNRDHSVVFEIASKYCILDSFVDHDGYSISSKGFLPTVVDNGHLS